MRLALSFWMVTILTPTLWAETVSGPVGRQLDDFMKSQESKGFYGALAVAREDRILLAKGYGFADREKQLPVTEETAFSTGSITKQFTAAAILKLEELGKLGVSDPISKYFQPVPPDKRAVTLHHLLTHTGGFPGAIGDDYAPVGREEFVQQALATPLEAAPGERYRYSNVGYSLLGAIIERVSGVGYEQFLRQHLFQPAGMEQTGYRMPHFHRLAHGYLEGRDWGTMLDQVWAEDGPYWHLRANGGIVSTPLDMLLWYRALRDGKVLTADSRSKLFTPHVAEGPEAQSFYGYGWSVEDTRWGKLVTHNGGNGIFRAEFQWFIEPDVFVYITSSRSDRAAFPLVGAIDRIVMGEAAPEEVVALPGTPAGRLIDRFLQVVRQGDADRYQEFLREHFAPDLLENIPAERHLQMLQNLRRDLSEAQLRGTLESPLQLEVLLQGQGGWLKLVFGLEEGAQPRIAGLTVDLLPEHRALDLLARLNASKQPAPAHTMEPPAGAKQSWGLPSSPTGRRGSQLLDAIHASRADLIDELIASGLAPGFLAKVSPEQFRLQLKDLHRQWGDFALVAAERTGPNAALLRVRTPGGTAAIEFSLEAGEPYRLQSLSVEMDEAGGSPEPRDPDFSSFEELDRHLEQETRAGNFSGVVLVGRQQEVLFENAYGMANKRYRVPNRVQTRFNLGSINKLFTAVGVLQLAAAGRIRLEDPLGRYLQGFPDEVAQKVTIGHLLRHESGWGSYWDNPDYRARRTELRRVSDYLEFIRKIPLDFEPGTGREYSNVGYEVLGAVIEAVSGQDYYDYVHHQIFAPAGMTQSGSFEIDATISDLATGYTNQSPSGPSEGFTRENTQMLSVRGTPAGGGYATASDLWRFARAVLEKRLLSERYTNFLLSRFQHLESGELRVAEAYGGGAPGVNAALEIDTGTGTVVVVLSNYDPPTAGRMARIIGSWLNR